LFVLWLGRYSDNAVSILKLAAERADELEHEYIGTEDLLHALFHTSHVKSRSQAVDRLFQRGVTEALVFGQAELSNNARLALKAAAEDANRRGHTRVGTEDLLRALFQNTKPDSKARYWLGQGKQALFHYDFSGEPGEATQVAVESETAGRLMVIGSLAGIVEAVVMQPFVYWKTMQQIRKPMSWAPAVAYRGVTINALSISPISGVQYAANGVLNKLFESTMQRKPSMVQEMSLAAGAGAVSSLIVTPAELIMISQQRSGDTLAKTLSTMWQAQGLKGFMRGFTTTTAREMGWTFGFLGLSPIFKKSLQEDSKFFRRNEVGASAVSSLVAGQVAAVITQPFDVVKTVIMADRGIGHKMRHRTNSDAIRHLYAEGGLPAFWRGLAPRSWCVYRRCWAATHATGSPCPLIVMV